MVAAVSVLMVQVYAVSAAALLLMTVLAASC